MLAISGLDVAYGGLRALREVSLEVGAGEFVAIVGPNGAGKTTLFKTISGTVAAASGRIVYEGHDLLRLPAAERARQVFRTMTVMENLEMGALSPAARARWPDNLARILQLFPALAERRRQFAGTLSGGEQQMLAIGRGLASCPRLLLLDEPSMGLAPALVDAIFDRITEIHRLEQLTILLVEQRVAEALESCDRGYVLDTGRVVLEGPRERLLADERVKRAYLGM